MFRRSSRLLIVLGACAATVSLTTVAYAYDPPTSLTGGGPPPIPLKNASMIVKTEGGYRYIAGQQNGHLTITQVDGNVRYVDTGTQELRDIPNSCTRQSVPTGIAAICDVPAEFEDGSEMYLEVWPRLGNDFVDGSTLPASSRLWTLGDKGDDTVFGGAGDDFVNGAQDNDTAYGGGGEDWIRTGIGNDELWGEGGDDRLVGVHDNDEIHGGEGDDRVGGGPGSDVLWGDAGRDMLACGTGPDVAHMDALDNSSQCEESSRS